MPLFSAMAQPGERINEKLNPLNALCFYPLNFDLRKTNEIYQSSKDLGQQNYKM